MSNTDWSGAYFEFRAIWNGSACAVNPALTGHLRSFEFSIALSCMADELS